MMKTKIKLLFILLNTSLFLLTAGFAQSVTKVDDIQNNADTLANKPLAGFQNKLLDIAFKTATLIPVKPHIKDRSKAQEAVVTTLLKLGQPKRVLGHIEKIENWRRGESYANLALYCVRKGYVEKAQDYIDLASQISEDAMDWRRDRIRVKIAKAYTLLGKTKKAEEFEKGVVDSESGKVAGVRAMMSDENYFDEQVKGLDELIATGSFDGTKNALKSYTFLFNRFYANEKRRLLVEKKIKASWKQIPYFIRIELLMDLAKFSLGHEDKNNAVRLLNETRQLIDSYQWPLQYRIPMVAKLIKLRFQAGDKKVARKNTDDLMAQYASGEQKIVNIDRAAVLRSIAEAYQSMGATNSALKVYKKAVEAGVANLNSRPRAEDLSATCSSMALFGVEPDAELWARINQIKTHLSSPW